MGVVIETVTKIRRRILEATDISEATDEQKDSVWNELTSSARPSIDFFVMVCLSAVIATLGLLINSSAVVIGGMLIAPLMLPLMAISLATVKGDFKLFSRGLETELKGLGFAVLVAIVVAYFVPVTMPLPAEIMVRTRPMLLDLLIALAGGVAGSYALIRGMGSRLPGVIIATALLPPLSTVGIGLVLRRADIALGALLLFAADIIAINLASSVMFWIFGFSPKWSELADKKIEKRLRVSAILLLVISLPLAWIMWDSINTAGTQHTIETVLSAQIEGIEGAKLVECEYERKNGMLTVTATIKSPKDIDVERTNEMKTALEKNLNEPVDLDLYVSIVKLVEPPPEE